MKKNVITILMAFLALSTFAQSNFGVDYFGIGEYPKAKDFFESQLTTAPAESNYYLGEIAWATGKVDEAIAFFDKGITADPLYAMNYIGKGKAMMKSNQVEAETIFKNTLKKNKKNAAVNVGIARAYYENGKKEMVAPKLVIARKVAKKSPLLYIFEGDMLVAEDKMGEAAGMYDQATYFDPNNVVATIKLAQVYESIQPALAVEKLEPLLAAHPQYTIINRNLGRAYNAAGKYRSAIESFVKYYGEGNCAYEDIYRLASAYYFADRYPESITLLDKGLSQDSTNFVFNRLRMYNASKTKDKENGVTIAEKFFNLKGSFIDKDYAAYAVILADAEKFSEALAQYDKVIASNAVKPETYKELAPIYTKMSDHVKAAESYQKYIDMVGGIDVAEGSDYYIMGRSWYNAGQALRLDSTETGMALAKEYFTKADTTFGVVCSKSPLSHIGYLWRGHTNAAMDPKTEQGLAKPYYEATLRLILKKIEEGANAASFRKDLINIYLYEAVYFYQKEDKENATLYSNKILELDPNNATAKSLLESYNPPAPEAASAKTKNAAK
jgi:tetratricopeptide (TPR) repeat protein